MMITKLFLLSAYADALRVADVRVQAKPVMKLRGGIAGVDPTVLAKYALLSRTMSSRSTHALLPSHATHHAPRVGASTPCSHAATPCHFFPLQRGPHTRRTFYTLAIANVAFVTMAPEKAAKKICDIDVSPIGAVVVENIGVQFACGIIMALCALNGVDVGKAVAWGMVPNICACSIVEPVAHSAHSSYLIRDRPHRVSQTPRRATASMASTRRSAYRCHRCTPCWHLTRRSPLSPTTTVALLATRAPLRCSP